MVDNAAAAAELLAWHNRTAGQQGLSKALRIWDMQRLQAYDKSYQQRKAQAAFPAGVFMLLLLMPQGGLTDPGLHTAMLRFLTQLNDLPRLHKQHAFACHQV